MDRQTAINPEQLQRDLRYICIMGLEGRRAVVSAPPVETEMLADLGYLDDKGGITPQGRNFMLSHERRV